jgi:hypothetical protein
MRYLVISENGAAQTSGFLLVNWLSELRDSQILDTETWPDFHAIVDGLVLSNYSGARDLQRRDE